MNLGPLFQSIGETGNQFADAKKLVYEQKMKEIFDKLGIKREQTEESEREERLRRLKLQPDTEEAKIQQQIDSAMNVAKKYGIQVKPEDIRSMLGFPAAPQAPIKTKFELWRAGHPQGTAEEFQEFEAGGKPQKKDDVKMTGDFVSEITDGETGISYPGHDPKMPDRLKSLVKEYEANAQKSEETRATREARKNAEALSRALAIGDMREAQKQRDEVFKTAKRGISGHSFLKTIAQQVNDAELAGGVGNKWGDMLIAEGFMQLMFGVDPKGIRGSPHMMQYLLEKQGGWDDRAIAEMNNAINGGKMSQEVRKKALEQAQMQIQSWDEQIRQTAGLVADAKTKALVKKYFDAVGAGEDAAMSGLGGKPHECRKRNILRPLRCECPSARCGTFH